MHLSTVTGSPHHHHKARLRTEHYIAPITISTLALFVIYVMMIAPETVPNWQVSFFTLFAFVAAVTAWGRLFAKRVDQRFHGVHSRIDDHEADDLVNRAIPRLRQVDPATVTLIAEARHRR